MVLVVVLCVIFRDKQQKRNTENILFVCFLPPGAPKVSMPSNTPGYYLQKGEVTCQVDSLIPFTLRFSREGEHLGVDQIFRCFTLILINIYILYLAVNDTFNALTLMSLQQRVY